MASLDDILTAAKNEVQATNNLAQTYLNVQGQKNFPAITSTTLVSSAAGRMVQLSVIVAGSAVGAIYDSNAAGSLTRQIAAIPNTVGITNVNIPMAYGIVVVPGTGQTVAGSYS